MFYLGIVLAIIAFAYFVGMLRKKEGEVVETSTTLQRGTESIVKFSLIIGVIILILVVIAVAINENHKKEHREQIQQNYQQAPPPPPTSVPAPEQAPTPEPTENDPTKPRKTTA